MHLELKPKKYNRLLRDKQIMTLDWGGWNQTSNYYTQTLDELSWASKYNNLVIFFTFLWMKNGDYN